MLSFSLFRVPVRVKPAFFVMALVLGAGALDPAAIAVWVGALFLSVLVHELGHAVVAGAFGQASTIELHGMGGTMFPKPAAGRPPLTTGQRCGVLLAGPFAGFVLGGAVWAMVPAGVVVPHLARVFVDDVVWITWGYGALNLVPIMPLDGGQVVHALLAAKLGARAKRASLVVDGMAGVGLAAAAIGLGSPRAAFLALWLLVRRAGEAAETVAELLDERRPAVRAFREAAGGNREEAVIALADAALASLKSKKLRAEVEHRLAWALMRSGRFTDAAAALERLPRGFEASGGLRGIILVALERYAEAAPLLRASNLLDAKRSLVGCLRHMQAYDEAVAVARALAVDPGGRHPDKHLLEAALFYAGRYEEALAVSAGIHAQLACGDSAWNAACSCAKLGRVDEGAAWFARAVALGHATAAMLESDRDLDPLREHSVFVDAVARIAPVRVWRA